MRKRQRLYDLLLGITIISVSVIGYYLIPYQVPPKRVYGSIPFTPDLFPRIVLIIGVILGVLLLIPIVFQYFKPKESEELEEEEGDAIRPDKVILVILLLLGYAFIMDILGYIATTFLFMSLVMLVLENKRYIILLSISVITTGVTYYVFNNLMKVPLPSIWFW